ncbi:MAG: hypothetical protein V4695_04920 [Pseudomonadota bacterium]
MQTIICLLLSAGFSGAATATDTMRPLSAAPTGVLEKIVRVGPTHAIRTIGEAARQAKDGDVVEIDAGDYPADVAIWTQNNLTIRVFNGRARLVPGSVSAEDKGTWVVRGGKISMHGIDFVGARSSRKNGAGIRFEKGHLVVRNCTFSDNENGILTAAGPLILEVHDSEFDGNGTVDGFGHSIYAGKIERLHVSGTYIHREVGGHLLKSRAAENHIVANRLTDEIGGKASYELEFPNGGVNYVVGNIIEQNPASENPAIVAVGMEGYQWPHNELYLVNNTIANDRSEGGNFLSVRPGIQRVKAVNNLLIGSGASITGTTGELIERILPDVDAVRNGVRNLAVRATSLSRGSDGPPLSEAGEFANNLQVDWDQFMLPSRYDYRLRSDSTLIGKVVPAGSANNVDLTQRLQYVHPGQAKPLREAPKMPGAMQLLGL